jgi:hypothetical protein
MSRVLRVPVAFFFDGTENRRQNATPGTGGASTADVSEFLATADILSLAKSFT